MTREIPAISETKSYTITRDVDDGALHVRRTEHSEAPAMVDRMKRHAAIRAIRRFRDGETTNHEFVDDIYKVRDDFGVDLYIVSSDYEWTFVVTHESEVGPYFAWSNAPTGQE